MPFGWVVRVGGADAFSYWAEELFAQTLKDLWHP